MSVKQKLKVQLHQLLAAQIQERITALQHTLASLEESRNRETKSSVGDKYETGRAMMQQEIFRKEAQLQQTMELKLMLSTLQPTTQHTVIQKGSLVETTQGIFYLSIGLGKVLLKQQTYFAISTQSPIGKELLGKKEGETISFRGKSLKIERVF